MDAFEPLLEPYRHVDPSGWVAVFRALPIWGGVLAIAIGLIMLLFGGRHLFRVVAGPLGHLIAIVWAAPLAARLGIHGNLKQVALISSYALLLAGLLWPPLVIFLAFAVPAGLLGGELAGANDWLLGFGPGFLLGGALGITAHRVVSAVLSAMAGAWALTMGLMATLHSSLPVVEWLANHPPVVLGLASALAAGGAGFQLFVRPSPEQKQKRKAEKAMARQRERETAAMEARFSGRR